MSSANKKHMQGGMNTTYSNVNTEDERNKKAEELLFQAWETAGYHGQPDEDYYPRTAQETRDMEDLLTQAEAAIDDPSDTELMEVMADTREVLEWSKQRHWTFAWWIIICGHISIVQNTCHLFIYSLYYSFTSQHGQRFCRKTRGCVTGGNDS